MSSIKGEASHFVIRRDRDVSRRNRRAGQVGKELGQQFATAPSPGDYLGSRSKKAAVAGENLNARADVGITRIGDRDAREICRVGGNLAEDQLFLGRAHQGQRCRE